MLLAIMIAVPLFVTHMPETFMRRPRAFFAPGADPALGAVIPACYCCHGPERLPAMPTPARFTIETGREADGRWIAEIPALPGVLAYGATREEAVASAKALASRVLAERLEHGEPTGELDGLFEAV
jgi:predicted RNase H-like HicB family nuclease